MLFCQRFSFSFAFCLALALVPSQLYGDDAAGNEFFEKRVRPILVARCYECHSGTAAKLKGGLRLDSLAATLTGGDTGPAIVPGNAKESLLVDAINYGDVYQMPPKSKLPADEIATLTKWVEMGAPWPAEAATTASQANKAFNLAQRKAEHWSWQPLKEPALPQVKNTAWPQQPLDRFVLAKLEEESLSPAPPADKRTLIRRAYFNLIGLPPTPEEVEAFVGDSSPQAFEKVVDRLLESPHFGERWGRHWLDLMRYAESRGHEFDYTVPNAWQYRDYVIRALNADVPYDQFVTEHVAGDLLPEPRRHPAEGFNESIIGTGFWFLGEWIHSPVDIRKDETDRMDNMVDVFSKTFLGLTVSCARCHDHKFDAISQQDYYALFGFLQSSSYRLARFDTLDAERRAARELAEVDKKHRPQLAALVAKEMEASLDKLAAALPGALDKMQVIAPVAELPRSAAGTQIEIIADYANLPSADWLPDGATFGAGPIAAGTILLGGEGKQALEIATYGSARRDATWNSLALAAGAEGDQAKLGAWTRAGRTLKTPTFELISGSVHYLIQGSGHIYAAVASHAMINGPLHGHLLRETGGDGKTAPRWITHDLSAYKGQRVHVEFSPKKNEGLQVLAVVQSEQPPPSLARPNKLVANLQREIPAEDTVRRAAAHRKLLESTIALVRENKLSAAEDAADWAQLAQWMVSQLSIPDVLTAAYDEARQKIAASVPRESRLCLAMLDGTGVDAELLIRGNTKTPGLIVPRRMLEALASIDKASGGREPPDELESNQGAHAPRSPVDAPRSPGSGRLELAGNLTSQANPFTSRVMVNRIWHHLLGRGIVPSVDNFGVLGQAPTHPELLDHLALAFIRDGWSLKRTIRTIMLSSTYQVESSSHLASGGREPPDLTRAHHGAHAIRSPRRLEGEAIRDAMLAISGRLDRTQFGPSVPVHLTPFMQGRGRPAASGPLDGAGRRSIYISVRRNFLSPLMLAFDTPIPASTSGRRNVSNVPAQALILMNDPFVVEQSRLWARKVLAERDQTPQDRIAGMYAAAFAREPSLAEAAAALAFLDEQAREYNLSADQAKTDERVWADLAHVLFNVKEFVFVR